MQHMLFAFCFGSALMTVTVGISHSMSCTYVNGEQRCEESHDDTGNFAGSSAIAVNGFGIAPSTYQGASTGNSGANTYNVQQSGTGGFSDLSPDASFPDAFVAPPVAPPVAPAVGFPFSFGLPGLGVGGFAGFPGVGTFAGVGFPGGVGTFAGAGGVGTFAGAGFPAASSFASPFGFGGGAFASAGKRKR